MVNLNLNTCTYANVYITLVDKLYEFLRGFEKNLSCSIYVYTYSYNFVKPMLELSVDVLEMRLCYLLVPKVTHYSSFDWSELCDYVRRMT